MDKILVTGGSGFLGRAIAKRFVGVHDVVLASRNGKALRHAGEVTGAETYPLDVSRLDSVLECVARVQPDVIIHAAATKFVDQSERFPIESIQVNVDGSANVAVAAMQGNVRFVLGVSTDKAAPPIANTYGLSKALLERTFAGLDSVTGTRFGCVRYGNVAWSTGSVLPIWAKMLSETGVIRSSGWNLSRFFFSVAEAVSLIELALSHEQSVAGKVVTVPMKGCEMFRILDLWVARDGGSWVRDTPRQGDRSLEFLIGEAEVPFTEERLLGDRRAYIVAFGSPLEQSISGAVSSANSPQLSDAEILRLLDLCDDD